MTKTELEMQKDKLIDQKIDYEEYKKILVSDIHKEPEAAINIIDKLIAIKKTIRDIANKVSNNLYDSIADDLEDAYEIQKLLVDYEDPTVISYMNNYICDLENGLELAENSDHDHVISK